MIMIVIRSIIYDTKTTNSNDDNNYIDDTDNSNNINNVNEIDYHKDNNNLIKYYNDKK